MSDAHDDTARRLPYLSKPYAMRGNPNYAGSPAPACSVEAGQLHTSRTGRAPLKADPVDGDSQHAPTSAPKVRPRCAGPSGPASYRRSRKRGFARKEQRRAGAAAGAAPPKAACAPCGSSPQGAGRGLPVHRGLLPRMPPPQTPCPPTAVAPPWHRARFIPEMCLYNRTALEAFRRHNATPKVALLNYFHLPAQQSGQDLGRRIRSRLGRVDALLLSCVGPDRSLDRLSIRRYDETARAIGADAVVSPDDYIYACDDAYRAFQAGNLARARKRTLDLLDMPRRPYSVIGLAAGSSEKQIRGTLEFLRDNSVHECAFPCGDHLKGGRRTALIKSFARQARELQMRSLLLGASCPSLLLQLNPSQFSNSEVCFGPAHDRAAVDRGLEPLAPPPPDPSHLARCMACLARNHALAGALGR